MASATSATPRSSAAAPASTVPASTLVHTVGRLETRPSLRRVAGSAAFAAVAINRTPSEPDQLTASGVTRREGGSRRRATSALAGRSIVRRPFPLVLSAGAPPL